MIHCSNCGKDFADSFKICPYCNTPAVTDEMSDTLHVMSAIKEIYATYGVETVRNKQRFISMLRDYIPEYEKERRLLTTAIENDIVEGLIRGDNDRDSAVAKAKEFMENDMFLSNVAIDFILEVFTYMLGWEHKPAQQQNTPYTLNTATISNNENATKTTPSSESATKTTPKVKNDTKATSKSTESKVFTPADASKYRLRGNVEIPSGYTAIKGFAFDEYSLLKSITIPEGVVAIGEYAFSNCVRLTSVKLPSSLRFIKTSAFESCTKLSQIEIPRGVVAIEDGTFQFCENLEKVIIPNTVGSIGSSAFSCCDKLKLIRIPDSVKYIGDSVFEYCPDIVVECYEYSYVHKYCQSSGIMFSLIQED
ncbi:MAG: leucine-rich repeat domain-containing protein [Ruminococcus sp.]|nr:leucine-rich repeat domain-containing protein [Ruminococcus sp.]